MFKIYHPYTPTHFTTRVYCGTHILWSLRRSHSHSEAGSIKLMKFPGHLRSSFVAMKYRILAFAMSNCDANGAR